MKITEFILVFVLSLFSITLSSQALELILDEKTVAQNDEVTLEITVNNFTNIYSMQFAVAFEPSNLEFVSYQDFNSDIGFTQSNIVHPDSLDGDKMNISWNTLELNGDNLDDGTVLFSITFKAIGSGGTTSPVTFSELSNGSPIEIIQDAEIVDPTLSHGSVTIEGGGGNDDLTFIIPEVNVDEGETFCLSMSVENFTNIGSFQYGYFYDPNVLTFENTGAYNLTDLDASSFNLNDPGILTVAYNVSGGTGVTVSDGTEIFEVCFTATGDEGDMSRIYLDDVDHGETTLVMEANDNDGNQLDIFVDEGKVTIGEGTGNEDFGVKLSPPPLSGVNEFCVPAIIQGSAELDNAQFTLKWDPDFVDYKEIKDFLYPGQLINDGSVDMGLLSVSWVSADGVPKAYESGDVFFEICFELLGECEAGSKIEFTEDLTPIEFSNINEGDIPTDLIDGDFICEPYSVDADVTNVSCGGECDGRIELTITGWEVASINWDDPDLTDDEAIQENVCEGTYSVTVTYTNGNEITADNIEVLGGGNLQVDVDGVYASLNGEDNGRIEVTILGGDGNYTYLYSPGGVAVEDPSDLSPGTYTLEVEDGSGCTGEMEFIVLDVGLKTSATSCANTEDGSAAVQVGGNGSGNYSYSWTCSASSEEVADDIPAGPCSLTITDDDLGFNNLVDFTIGSPDPIIIDVIDVDEDAGSIDVEVSGGAGSYSYYWIPSGETTQDLSGAEDGSYKLVVTDQNGCTAESEIINLGESSDVLVETSESIYGRSGVSCPGNCDGYIRIIPITVSDISVSWGDGETGSNREELCAGSYSFTVTDSDGNLIEEGSVELEDAEPLGVEDMILDCDSPGGGSVEIVAVGGSGVYLYSINGAVYEDTSSFDGLDITGDYTAYIRDNNGCEYAEEFSFDDCGDSQCYKSIPVITPNGDNRNDRLTFTCFEDDDATLEVYTKWGEMVYRESGYDQTWQGDHTDGNPLPEDMYLWVLKVKRTGGVDLYRGSVHILRSFN